MIKGKTAPRDTSIGTYRAKRNFARTAEPQPSKAVRKTDALIFVVQKHDASRLHYDFRLEHDGVLWSWAIPKGPSLDPKDKRLAVHVEDHPRDYATFEGTIPAGEYGGGTVKIWDRGTWTPLGDPKADLARGEMKFELAGERLHGRFVFIRLKPRPKERAENWLLIKEHDSFERPGVDATTIEAEGALSAAPAKRALRAPEPRERRSRKTAGPAPDLRGAVKATLPDTQAPQLATLVESPPDDADWLCEIKFDGYRLLAFKNGKTVKLTTRSGQDWTSRLPGVADLVSRATAETMLLDCELVALRPDGLSSFAELQAAPFRRARWRPGAVRLRPAAPQWLGPAPLPAGCPQGGDGQAPFLERSAAVSATISRGMPAQCGRQACTMGLEGIIAKRADAPYRPGRSHDWVKLKCAGREEFVILGWTPPRRSRVGIGALEVGFYDPDGHLHYAGGVGTGFTDGELRALRVKLDLINDEAPPGLLVSGEKPDRSIVWVRPELVAELQFVGWSGGGRVRHAVYLGLREDKPAMDVVRPVPDAGEPRKPLQGSHSGVLVTASPPTRKAPVRRAGGSAASPAASPAPAREGVRLTHPDKQLWPWHHQAGSGGLLGRGRHGCTPRHRRAAAGAGALPGWDRRPAFLPEARNEGDEPGAARGRAGRRTLSGARRRRRAAGMRADGGHRAA